MNTSRDLFESFESVAASKRELVKNCEGASALDGAELLARALTAARLLEAEGAGRGDLVLLQELSGLPLVVALLAVWARDAVALPVEAAAPAEIEGIREQFHPRFVLAAGRDGLEAAELFGGKEALALPSGAAVIKLTSGSTGKVRGIAVRAAQLAADGRQILQGMGIHPDDTNIGVIPLSHSYGLGNLIMPLVLQASPLLLVSAPLPELLREALSREEPCVFPGVPILFDNLANLPGPGFTAKGLRLCISAGAPLRRAVARAFGQRYGLPVRAFYGASECGGITFDASPGGDAAEIEEGCVGTALPGVEIGLEGEEERITVRSAAVASGYVPPALPGEETFFGARFKTGDTGRVDTAGRLILKGRIGSLVNVAGRKVNPREVEAVLMAMSGVGDAAVVGVPDAARGETLVACLVAQREVTRKQVMDRLRAALAEYKLPRRIVFVEMIPRNDRGKVPREEILRLADSSTEGRLRRQSSGARERRRSRPTHAR